eukprot:c20005_g1_i2.p1 GENE.c20005_g1_i2~~c20005_g1_i2.p1  ORF type:complete len:480 (+),score=120.92 c20005_g1_i2:31-1440(+)
MTESGLVSDEEYLKRILRARVYDVAIESPLDHAPRLSAALRNHILFKREDLQPVFSFKLRGAYNKMANLNKEQLACGVICSSAGNHAQGVALAAKKLGTTATIVMPETTPSLKVDAVRARGGNVVLHGSVYDDAYGRARQLEAEEGMTFVHPFDDPDVIAGQGTIGMEILRQAATPVSAIFVAIGGGGLISGIATYVKQVYPEIKIIGVEPVDSNAMKLSLDEGRRVTLSTVGVFADGVAVRQVGAECFRLAQKFVDEVVLVTTDEMCAAIRDVFEDTRSILEPSGALAIAGMKRYVQRTGVTDQTLVAVASGANMNFERLKFVTERAEIGQNKEALFAVTIPERPRHLWSFLHVIGRRSITEFNYRMSNTEMARIFVGVAVSGLDDAVAVRKTFETAGYQTVDLTSNELAKLHVKYMVGGRSELAISERLFRCSISIRCIKNQPNKNTHSDRRAHSNCASPSIDVLMA